MAACLLATAGCADRLERLYSSNLPLDTPIDWWHQLQGGTIANERPPPPGVGLPYPTINSIPAKPTPTDAVTRRALSTRLAGDRTSMERANAQDPLVAYKPVTFDPTTGIPAPPPNQPIPVATPARTAQAATPATPAPAKSATATPAPATPASATPATDPAAPMLATAIPDEPPPMARIEAATAPAPARTPAPAPAAPAPAAIQQAASPRAARPAPGSNLVAGPAPDLPTAPPPLPNLSGIPAESLVPAPRTSPQAEVAFLPNSAVLRPESTAALRTLANRRSGGPVAILGGGDATSAAPDAQAAALPLAWRRARAMQAALEEAGVPVSAMRVDAAALGRGGIARLLN